MKKPLISALVIFAVILTTFFYYYLAVVNSWWPIAISTVSEKGQFGDSFGLFTSLFSALAFGGILFTIWYQHDELQKSRDYSNTQNFESLLFNLLANHNSIIEDIDIHSVTDRALVASGRDCFHRYVVRHLKPSYKRLKNAAPDSDELDLARNSFGTIWLRHRHNLSHYLRFLYNIFKFIDSAEISPEMKKKYSNIVRSQLSDYELVILFYNCLHRNGSERFKPLIEKYAIFNNLPDDLLLNPTHRGFYSSTAFS